MNAAQRVIEKFGGQSALAKLINRGQSTVQYWAKTGVIPARWHQNLIQLATATSIDLSPSDFMDDSALGKSPAMHRRPVAKWWGTLAIGEDEIACYVLDDGRRVISRTGATSFLTSSKGGGNLDSYIGVEALKPYISEDLPDQLVEFELSNVVNKDVAGMGAETFLDICRAYARARDDGARLTPRQHEIALKANALLMASAKVGLIALIDEATGYQYDRAADALQFKLKVFLADEMRQWEKTFPDELWREFGRLTNWKGALHQRPKYWGKLVNELVYGYLDKDVYEWLKRNAPAPRHGQNYHQWLSSQYGLKKLVEHLWMLVGMASACHAMSELRQRMGEKFGRVPVQFNLFLPPLAN